MRTFLSVGRERHFWWIHDLIWVSGGTAGEGNIPSSQLSRLDFTTTSHAWFICFRKKEKALQDRTSGCSRVSDVHAFPWEGLDRTTSSMHRYSWIHQTTERDSHWKGSFSFSFFLFFSPDCLLFTWFCLVWCAVCLSQRCWPVSLISSLPLSCKLLWSKKSRKEELVLKLLRGGPLTDFYPELKSAFVFEREKESRRKQPCSVSFHWCVYWKWLLSDLV